MYQPPDWSRDYRWPCADRESPGKPKWWARGVRATYEWVIWCAPRLAARDKRAIFWSTVPICKRCCRRSGTISRSSPTYDPSDHPSSATAKASISANETYANFTQFLSHIRQSETFYRLGLVCKFFFRRLRYC